MNKLKTHLLFLLILVLIKSWSLFAEDIIVSDGAIDVLNGIYTEQGMYNGKPCYENGESEIRYKGCRAKWVLLINGVMYYRNMTDSELCPLDGWLTACKAKEISNKVPEFEVKISIFPNN